MSIVFLQKNRSFDIFLSILFVKNKNPFANCAFAERFCFLNISKDELDRILYPRGTSVIIKRCLLRLGNVITKSRSVSATAPNANLVRDLLLCKSKGKFERSLGGHHGIGGGVPKEGRRRLLAHLVFKIEKVQYLGGQLLFPF